MLPQKCIERKCARKAMDGAGNDVCVLYRVSETEDTLAVLNVFNVSEKQCKRLRVEARELEGGEE